MVLVAWYWPWFGDCVFACVWVLGIPSGALGFFDFGFVVFGVVSVFFCLYCVFSFFFVFMGASQHAPAQRARDRKKYLGICYNGNILADTGHTTPPQRWTASCFIPPPPPKLPKAPDCSLNIVNNIVNSTCTQLEQIHSRHAVVRNV